MRQALGNGASLPELRDDRGWTELLARALARPGGDDLEDDAIQDAWVAALRRPPSTETPLEPWARAVVRNQLLNRLRGDDRRRGREAHAPLPEAPPAPDERLARKELHELLVEAVTALPAPYRETVLLRYFDGLSATEIAARVNVPPTTVRGRLRTAIGLLREALEARRLRPQGWLEALVHLAAPRRAPVATHPPAMPVAARPWPSPLIRALAGVALVTAATVPTISSWTTRRTPDLPHAPAPVPTFATVSEAPVATEPPAPQPPPTVAALPPPIPSIAGTVRLLVAPPPPTPAGHVDHWCARHGTHSEEIVVGPAGGLANVIVRVVSGRGLSGALAAEGARLPPAVLRQQGCRYQPRVLPLQLGQPLAIANDDEIVHHLQGWRDTTLLLNQALVPGLHVIERRFEIGDVIRLGAGESASMTGALVVVENPFVTVTADDGRFALAALPPGMYRVEAWHERLGARSGTVAVNAGHTTEVAVALGEGAPLVGFLRDPCRIATGKGPVAQACARGGIRSAREKMKAMVKAARAGSCDGCHRDDEQWTLTPDARARFERLFR